MDNSVFVLKGWRFEAVKSSALSSFGRADMSERFLLPHVPLPEMLFAENALIVTHEATGWSVTFRAEDALETWAKTQRQEHHVEAIEYDVAYTCHYRGSIND
ncbi:hypothetical protein THRCLA_21448 [Thraustotheca clavata]|uniref:Uncharacterized protein n=1 Tax=Thraustotheca clavata TaxID=74557 RepID=A0A1V9ZWB5_9STRA|nr:hypothetical protein THRCLA_21448 [Thraustotheca clavata]